MEWLEDKFIWDINTSKVEIYSQKIHDCRNSNSLQIQEVLCREEGIGVSEKLNTLNWESKVTFDFFVIERFLEIFPNINSWNTIFNINLEPKTIISPNFRETLLTLFKKHNFNSFNLLAFEITENWFFTSEEIIILNKNISFLRSMWIKVWIDDYPNENNNNELLEKVEDIDFIKIDKWFLLDYLSWKISQKMFLSLIKKLVEDIKQRKGNIPIIIEWVETKELYELIRYHFWNSIIFFQWYYFHYPEKLNFN